MQIKTYGDPTLSTFSSGTNFPAFFEYLDLQMKDNANFPKMGMPVTGSNPVKGLLYFIGAPSAGQRKDLAFRVSDQNLHRIVVYQNAIYPFQSSVSSGNSLANLYSTQAGIRPLVLRYTSQAVNRGTKVQFQCGPDGSTYTNVEMIGVLASNTPGSEAGIARVNVMMANQAVKMAWEADQKQKYHSWAISDVQKMRLTQTGLDLTLNYGYSFPTDVTSESPSLPLAQGKQFYRYDLRQNATYSGDFGWHNVAGHFQPAGAVLFVDQNKMLNAGVAHIDPINKYTGIGTTQPEFVLTVDAQWPGVAVMGVRRASSGAAPNFLILRNTTSAVGSGSSFAFQANLDDNSPQSIGSLAFDFRNITSGSDDGRGIINVRGGGATRNAYIVNFDSTVNSHITKDRYGSTWTETTETGVGLGGVTPTVKLDIGTGAIATRATSPTQITSNQNNYDIAAAGWLRISTDASRNVTGLKGGQDGRRLVITNTGSNDLVLTHLDNLSSVENQFRFSTGTNITLTADDSIQLIYDSTTSRWRDI